MIWGLILMELMALIMHYFRLIKKFGNKFHKINMNFNIFPFANEFFNFIRSFYSVEYIRNIKFFVKEMYRILKNDGLVFF
jgi:ubiquinone/menaquinone biosynthesis C-methylase UbiE